MKKLSSPINLFYKWIFPVGIVGLLVVFSYYIFDSFGDVEGIDILILLVPILLVAGWYFKLRAHFLDLVDEVYDDGSSLLFKKGNKRVRVNLNDIKNVSYMGQHGSARVTISLRQDSEIGRELSFYVPMSLAPFMKNQDIESLIDRIDEKRS